MTSKPDFELPLTNMPVGSQNGRVVLESRPSAGGPPPPAAFMFQQKGDDLAKVDLMRGNWEENPVSDLLFSVRNINALQKRIRDEVYRRSGAKQWNIDEQDVDELKIIMRSMYYQWGKNLPTDIEGQVSELNTIIIDYAVPRIMSEIQHYLYYLNDIDKMPVPLSRPILLTKAGTKSLPFNPLM
jgi:hypothetical protein